MQDEVVYDTRYGRFALSSLHEGKFAARFARGDYWQGNDIALLSTLVDETSVVVDVGAHIGTTSIPLARLVKTVLAFEPVAETRAYLEKNIALNNISNIIVYTVAVGEAQGTGTIGLMKEGTVGSYSVLSPEMVPEGETESVHLSTLDAEIKHVDLLKTDTEGFELQVLRGAKGLIERSRPVIFFEVFLPRLRQHGASASDLKRFLSMHGYRFYVPLADHMQGQGQVLGRVFSLELVAYLLFPRALFGGAMEAFDILAIPKEKKSPLKIRSAAYVLALLFVYDLWKGFRVLAHTLGRAAGVV